ncbi:hypothetical protein ACN20G_19440 [Streptomyces sp. BI20]|uniref:hypothetical protein n=1 Tax=Streptomyces sp. BI20 TaxID=3403460 RepID=UPI003C72A6E4
MNDEITVRHAPRVGDRVRDVGSGRVGVWMDTLDCEETGRSGLVRSRVWAFVRGGDGVEFTAAPGDLVAEGGAR